jgi:aspartyl-tRNA(Asn)/glutamyl-tRNA(Gln) amidotransferase subunit C
LNLTTDDVRKLARLARVGLDEDTTAAHAASLSNVLGLLAPLERTDPDDVAPMLQPLNRAAHLRPDRPDPAIDRAAFQALAPDVAEGLYRVPKVIE